MLQSFPLVRLAALDLDGTLLNRNNEVSPLPPVKPLPAL